MLTEKFKGRKFSYQPLYIVFLIHLWWVFGELMTDEIFRAFHQKKFKLLVAMVRTLFLQARVIILDSYEATFN